MREPDTLYYDGSCPLCQREMSHLAKLKSDRLVLQDIHALPPGAEGPDKETLLQNLHLKPVSYTHLTLPTLLLV